MVAKAQRRQYTAEYKLRILREVEACQGSDEIGALLRQEGLYSSNLTNWRRQRECGELDGLSAHKRGLKVDLQVAELARLNGENERLQERLRKAELIIEVQKKFYNSWGCRSKRTTQTSRVDPIGRTFSQKNWNKNDYSVWPNKFGGPT